MNKIRNLLLFTGFLWISCNMHHPFSDGVFHADAAHTGIFDGHGYSHFGSEKWRFKTNGKIFSSPLVVNGTVYVGSEDSSLYAIRSATGELLWRFPTHGAVSSSPALYNNTVYFTSYDGFCYAVNAETGKEAWKFQTAGEKKVGAKGLWTMKPVDTYMEDLWDFFLSSPVIGINAAGAGKGPTVYFGSSDGNLYAVNALKGSLEWKFKTNGVIHTSPALYRGIIYFGSWDTYLYAVDGQTGKEIWKFKTGDQPVYHVLEGIQASPAVADSIVYFGARDGFFYALNAFTGAMVWHYDADHSWILTTAAVSDSAVYFGTSDTYLLIALDAKTGHKKFGMKTNGYVYSSPVIAGQTAYFGDFTGNLYALDLASGGKTRETFSTAGRKMNEARILNPKGDLDFVFTAGVQDLTQYASSEDVMNEFYKLGSVVSSPAISGNTVYFGSSDSNLYAVALKD
jgi:eukaryotic-like serine/threonine-protein kinase